MVTKVPLLASQTPLNAVGVGECSGWRKNVLVLQSLVCGCEAASGCVTGMGGMRAPAFRGCLILEEDAEVVGGGELMVVLRS